MADPASLPADLDAQHRKLVGTAWKLDKMAVRFINDRQVHVSGPEIDVYAPGGITTKYQYAGGQVEVTVLGKTVTATWDGAVFSVGGLAATVLDAPIP